MKKIRFSLWFVTLFLAFLIYNDRICAVENNSEQSTRQEEIKEFLNCKIVPQVGNLWDYTFEPDKFPEVNSKIYKSEMPFDNPTNVTCLPFGEKLGDNMAFKLSNINDFFIFFVDGSIIYRTSSFPDLETNAI